MIFASEQILNLDWISTVKQRVALLQFLLSFRTQLIGSLQILSSNRKTQGKIP